MTVVICIGNARRALRSVRWINARHELVLAVRSQWLHGRMLGVWLVLAAAELIGFGMAGLVQNQAGVDGLSRHGGAGMAALVAASLGAWLIAPLVVAVGALSRADI